MNLIYVGILINFVLLISSWFFFFSFFKPKNSISDKKIHSEIDEIKKDLILVTKNPAAARRKLKSSE